MRRRLFCLSATTATLCGCAGAVNPVPVPQSEAVARAAAEIGNYPPPPRRVLASGEVTATLTRISRRLEGPAQALCREIGRATCDWQVQASRSRDLNAYAALDGRVVINRGILEYARREEEVALVVAHELAHQAANHVAQSRDNAELGAAIGAVLGGALVVAGALGGARTSARANRQTVEGLAGTGARLADLSFSKEQEREADHLGIKLLARAGYDPMAARGFVITMARASRRRETGLFDSHPAGPERLAAFDATVAALRPAQPSA